MVVVLCDLRFLLLTPVTNPFFFYTNGHVLIYVAQVNDTKSKVVLTFSVALKIRIPRQTELGFSVVKVS